MSLFAGHGGDVYRHARDKGIRPADLLDFSVNLNPLGPPSWLRDAISRSISDVIHYPDLNCTAFVEALSKRFGVGADCVVPCNGTSEIIFALPRLLGKNRALIPEPAYIDYRRAALSSGLEIDTVTSTEHQKFEIDLSELDRKISPNHIVFIGQPANPVGTFCDQKALKSLAEAHPRSLFVIDEAYIDFVLPGVCPSLRSERPDNLVVLYSLTKTFSIPGLRLGAVFAATDVCARLREYLPPWNMNTFALAVGKRALKDAAYLTRTAAFVEDTRRFLASELGAIDGLTVFPSSANYVLAKSDIPERDAKLIAKRLLEQNIMVRLCDNYVGLDSRYFRVAVKSKKETNRLIGALRAIVEGRPSAKKPAEKRRRAVAIMVQGTGSDAGKSLLCAGLCRILKRAGHTVAPFKAQNMSLNSHVTLDGKEMGRAQALQAAACGLEPDVRMNPVLLKPNSETGSQVILLGKAIGHMGYNAYSELKAEMLDKVHGAYDELASEYDIVVIEGAGSPAEINLKRRDIVNMHMAEYADAKVLLVGDIERGGIFASFVGTMELLSESERSKIGGFVINRFRGDAGLLDSGIEYLEDRTGCPVLGTVPFIRDLGLPEEDSVSLKNRPSRGPSPDTSKIDIAVVDLPHISNFTDFDPLAIEPDVALRLVRKASELSRADVVILPGSKNVPGDLAYMKETGISDRVIELAIGDKTFCVGICAGFQMLGERIIDPSGIETRAGQVVSGLGLLQVSTTLEPEKTLVRTAAIHAPTGRRVQGYEIHHGRTECFESNVVWKRPDGETIGVSARSGRVWGTYLHGVFDDDGFRRWFIDEARQMRGMTPAGKILARFDIGPALDRLADIFADHLNMPEIMRLMEVR